MKRRVKPSNSTAAVVVIAFGGGNAKVCHQGDAGVDRCDDREMVIDFVIGFLRSPQHRCIAACKWVLRQSAFECRDVSNARAEPTSNLNDRFSIVCCLPIRGSVIKMT